MEMVEIVDNRYIPSYTGNYLKGCKGYFYIRVHMDKITKGFLIWPGGEIKLRHRLSNKRMRKLKINFVSLTRDPCRCVVGRFGGNMNNYMTLGYEAPDYFTLSYDPTIDVRVLDDIMWVLERLKLWGP